MNKNIFLIAPMALTASLLSGCTIHTYDPGPQMSMHAAAPKPVVRPPAPPAPVAATVRPESSPRKVVLLGVRKVGFGSDKDTIVVNRAGKFRSIKLHVSGSPMDLYDIKVTFADGSRYSPPTRLHFKQGSWTRIMDLPGDKRHISKVEFWYRSKGPKSGRAKVQLFGMS